MGKSSHSTDHPHPSDAALAAFAVGSLSEAQAGIIEDHVNQCGKCAAVVAQAPRDAFVDRLLAAQRSTDVRPRPNSHSPECGQPAALTQSELDRLPVALRNHPRYEVVGVLAEGGMSTVYLARHRVTQSLVAMKAIKPELAARREPVARFLREARIVGQLSHENIARVLDAEQCGESVFIAMENVPGRTLAQIVATEGPLQVAEACHYVRQIALGLQHACNQGVVHRDIKPQNIMILPSSRSVQILDFGLGRLVEEHRTRSRLTRDRQILGTPDYMAPEQTSDSKSADTRADIYSLGCTFYFLLIGKTPFQADSAVELFAKHENERPPSVRSIRSDVPQLVSDLLDRMLAKSPQDRPQSPGEIAAALVSFDVSDRASRVPHQGLDTKHSGKSFIVWSSTRIPALLRSPAVLLPLFTLLLCLLSLFLVG